MKIMLFFGALVVGITFTALSLTGRNAAIGSEPIRTGGESSGEAGKRPVLVELFTSEGCSSCPPADRLLTAIAKENRDAITLAYHVDYWDRLGWKDRFSSAAYSRRQEEYGEKFKLGSIYTPQMVVGGTAEFVGNNRSKADENISRAASQPAGQIDLSLKDGKLNVNIRDLGDHGNTTVYLAIAENGLWTKVGAGENSGSRLEHSGVVRQLTAIGEVGRGKSEFKAVHEIPANKEWNAANLKYVVFAQEKESLKILAVAAAAR